MERPISGQDHGVVIWSKNTKKNFKIRKYQKEFLRTGEHL
jgi:hypothetical protein